MRIAGYEFADGARFQPGAHLDPLAVGKHLELLRQQCKGELTPADVLADARHNNSPLHTYFEWDDSAAAEQYRLKQARGLIRAVVAIYVEPEKPASRVKAFVHIPEAAAPHYRATHHAMSQKSTRDMVLRRAWEEFMAWKKRYQDLQEFADLFAAAEVVAKKLPKSKS
jgi:hypothetical protein